MIRYLIQRVVTGLILLFVFVSILFFAIQIILPGDFASQYALALSPQQIEGLRTDLGLDLPLLERYLRWIGNLLRGDLGRSFTPYGEGPPVMEIILATLPATLLVFGIGSVLAFSFGVWLGKVTAWKGPGLTSSLITFSSIAFYTSFPPWLAFLLIFLVASRLNMPYLGLSSRIRDEAPDVITSSMIFQMIGVLIIVMLVQLVILYLMKRWVRWSIPAWLSMLMVAGIWFASWYVIGIDKFAIEIIQRALLPIITYSLLSFGEMMLIMRTSMVDTLHEEFIQTARAKGLRDSQIRDRHAARNALLPVASRMVISIPFLMSGMVMIERVLNWPGIGTSLFNAVGMQNMTLALGLLIVIGLIALLSRLILEVVQVLLDPRLRIQTEV
ncbi:MAG TPA: ABC transporter permease [Anaerolineales bacterium]|nr:ABC transporter permease [Anaerolineales bacterium]